MNNKEGTTFEDQTLLSAPPFAAVVVLDEDDEEKLCRICLEDDEPSTMIAPCTCRGSSKWVHRACLDQWRIHERDRAFSQCTECHFTYHMEAKGGEEHDAAMWRRAKFYMLMSRDILAVTLVLQLIICFLGWIVFLMDTNNVIVDLLNGGNHHHHHCSSSISSSSSGVDNNHTASSFFWCNHVWSVYYLCGLFALFILLGFYGCVIFSSHRCSVRDSFQRIRQNAHHDDDVENPPSISVNSVVLPRTSAGDNVSRGTYVSADRGTSLHAGRQHYRPQYRNSTRNNNNNNGDCCHTCCLGGGGHRGRGYSYFPYDMYYCYCPDSSGGCCDGGDCLGSSRGGGTSSGGGNQDCGGDNMHILLMVLLVIAIVMALVGFFVGLVIAVVIGQRILQRHVFLLHKRRLVREFIVKDLQDYGGGDGVLPTAPVDRGLDNEVATAYPPNEYGGVAASAPPAQQALHQKDVQHLKKLGLMD